MSKEKILIVEDEFVTGAEVQARLQDMGYDVPEVIDNGEEAVKKAGELKPDLIVMDIILKGAMTGIEAAETIKSQYSIPVVFLTAHSDDATVNKAMHSEPFGYLIKPLDERALKTTIKMALYKHDIDNRLRQSEETIRTIINATKDAIVLVDIEGKILALNEAFAQSAGKPVDGLLNTVIYELIKTGGITMQIADMMQKQAGTAPVVFTEEDGDRWFETTIYSINDTNGSRKLTAVFRHDISALKRSELEREAVHQELEQEKQHLSLLASALDNMSDCAIITDSLGTITYVNVTFEKKFAIQRKTVINTHISELAHADNKYPLSKDAFIQYKDSDNIGRFMAKNAYGVKMPMILRVKPILIENNRPKNFVFVLIEAGS